VTACLISMRCSKNWCPRVMSNNPERQAPRTWALGARWPLLRVTKKIVRWGCLPAWATATRWPHHRIASARWITLSRPTAPRSGT